MRKLWEGRRVDFTRLERLHQATRVEGRYLARPLADYEELNTFAKKNKAWGQSAVELGEKAVHGALQRAGLTPGEVDHLFFVTLTGISTPSVDAQIANRLGFRADLKRTPIFGLGCVAGAAGLARAADYLRAYPDQVAVLLSVELCSLTLQPDDLSTANMVATGLFGDGAAAAVLGGGGRPESGPRVIASQATLYPDTEWVMGWEIVDSGFKVVLSAKVPEIVREHIRVDVDRLLSQNGLSRKEIRHWVSHPGGPKVLEALQQALELPPEAFAHSWQSLKTMGNLASASVLCVLEDTLEADRAQSGDRGLVLALGPGFGAELLLLEW
jgi:alkylresorcinol/alkylpyrone synthase